MNEMIERNAKQLVTVNLKYSSWAKPLKVLAFAQLASKALFLSGGQLGLADLATRIAKLIGINNVSDRLVQQGLQELMRNEKAIIRDEKWELKEDAIKEIKEDIEFSKSQLKEVLKKHFPRNIDDGILSDWFYEVSANFFGCFGDDWVRSVCRNAQIRYPETGSTDEFLNRATVKYNLGDYRRELVQGFLAFLSSDDQFDQQYLVSLGFAMFYARLVAADVSADPLSLDELRGSKFILDTNFLIAIHLEKRQIAKSLGSLGSALKTIGSKLVYIYETQEEYNRVVSAARGGLLDVIDKYPFEVIAGVDDDFINAAIGRGCVRREEFETFFTDIGRIAKSVQNGPPILVEDDSEIQKEVENAKKDEKLKDSIQQHVINLKGSELVHRKTLSALSHDAAILRVAKLVRKRGEKCWIISFDKTLQDYAIAQSAPYGTPFVLSVGALIQILAVNNAGPEFDPCNFAPLLASIMLNQCAPLTDTYEMLDLQWLYRVREEVASFPPVKTQKIASYVKRERMLGKSVDSSEFQRNVNRLYQEEISGINLEIADAQERARVAEESRREEIEIRKKREAQLVKLKSGEIVRSGRRKLIRQLLIRVFLSAVFFFFIFIVTSYFLTRGELLGTIFGIIGFVGSCISFCWRSVEKHRELAKDVESVAKKELGLDS